MFNAISTEAMQAQLHTKLGDTLDSLWQKVIDYRDQQLKDDTSYQSRKRKLTKFFLDNIASDFIKTVYKYTGLYIKTVKALDIFQTGSFCTWIFFGKKGDQRGTVQIENMLNGGYLKRYWGTRLGSLNEFKAEELIKLASSYDAIHGCIKPEYRDEVVKVLHSNIGFDIVLAFMIEDCLPKNSGIKNYTARELTAIVLHEIGHTLTLLEHAGDMFAHTASFNYLFKTFADKNANNPGEVIKLAKMVATKAETTGNVTTAKQLTGVVNRFAADLSSAGASAKPETVNKLTAGLLDGVIALIGDLFLIPLNMMFGNAVTRKYAPLSAEQRKKFSDIPCNERLCTWQERKADEFAFSHGYGAELTEGLSKIGSFIRFLGTSEKEAERIRLANELGQNIGILEKFGLLCMAPHLCGNYSYTLYPAGTKRFKELLKITIQQLKANGAQPEYVAKYMADIDRILYQIDHCDKGDEFKARMVKGYELFNAYVSIPSWIDMLVHGHIRKEIETLVDELQDVGSNLIDYYGNKFIAASKKG